MIDEAGNLVGELKRVPGVGKEFNYYFTDYNGANGVTKNKQYVLQSKSKIITSASPGNYRIPTGQNILYMDFNLPKNISANYSGLGKMMFDDAFTYYNRSNKIDGIYGECIKSHALVCVLHQQITPNAHTKSNGTLVNALKETKWA